MRCARFAVPAPSIPEAEIVMNKGHGVARTVPVFCIDDYCVYYFCIKELEDVLCGRKFAYPPEISRTIVRELEAVSELVFPTRKIAAVKADPYDNLILECAVEAGVDYVVSGDNHLLELKRFEDIPILSPAQFLKVVD